MNEYGSVFGANTCRGFCLFSHVVELDFTRLLKLRAPVKYVCQEHDSPRTLDLNLHHIGLWYYGSALGAPCPSICLHGKAATTTSFLLKLFHFTLFALLQHIFQNMLDEGKNCKKKKKKKV